MTELMPHRQIALPARRRPELGATGPALSGQLLAPGEEAALTAEEVARGWLLGYAESRETLRVYRYAAGEWFSFCAEYGVDPLHAKRPLVELYKNALYDRGRSPGTVNARLSALSSFYTYAVDEDAVASSPLRGVRRPKLPDQAVSTGLTRPELRAFLAEARERGPQMFALMTLLGLNGLRVSESLLCQVTDFGSERGHRTLAVDRKGVAGKVRVPLAPPTVEALDAWLEARALHLSADSGLLFYKIRRGTREVVPHDRRDVRRYVRYIARVAVPDKPTLHPHDLRHAFVTLALDAGVPLRDVQDSAGHASPLTTRRYDRGRGRIDRHATYTLAAYLGGGA